MSRREKQVHFGIVALSLIILATHFVAHYLYGNCLWWKISPVMGPIELAFGVLGPVVRYFDLKDAANIRKMFASSTTANDHERANHSA